MKKLYLLILLCVPLKSVAGIDPGRVAAIELASDQAKKTIESQEKAQLLMTTGHVWIKEEVEATTDFQREFNDYLDKFHDVLSIAAEIYGIYYEVTQTSKCVKDLGHVLADSPENALAVAFSTRRNVVYRNIVRTTLDVIMDIRKVCFESSKMTEQEKNKVISAQTAHHQQTVAPAHPRAPLYVVSRCVERADGAGLLHEPRHQARHHHPLPPPMVEQR